MAEYSLELLHSGEMPAPSGQWAQFTYAVLPSAAMCALFAALAAAGLILPAVGGAPAWAIAVALLWAALMALIAWMCWSKVRAGLRPSNWLLRADDSGLYLKFRSYLNYRFTAAEPDVVFVPRAAVAWIRGSSLLVRRNDAPNRTGHEERRRHLDIKLLDDSLLAPLRAQLHVERGLWHEHGRGARSRSGHRPVTLAGEGRLRVHWSGKGDAVRPALPQALQVLARWYRVAESEEAVETPAERLSRTEREARILALAEQGEHMEAIKLARDLYGLGLKDAKDFVDRLRGR